MLPATLMIMMEIIAASMKMVMAVMTAQMVTFIQVMMARMKMVMEFALLQMKMIIVSPMNMTVLEFVMVIAGTVTVDELLQITPVMNVMTVLVFQMVLTQIRVVAAEYMTSFQPMVVMMYVVQH